MRKKGEKQEKEILTFLMLKTEIRDEESFDGTEKKKKTIGHLLNIGRKILRWGEKN